MAFKYSNVFKPNEPTQDYHSRKPNDENFLIEIGDKNYIYVGEKVITFETNDTILNYSSELGFNDFKYPFAYGEENVYFLLYQNYIPLQEYRKTTEKDDYQYFYKKRDENKGIVEYGKNFINCEIISNKNSN